MDKPKFLYHGSSSRVDILMPYQTADFLNAPGSQNAVFATSNRDVALAFALGTVPDETGGVTRVILSLDPVEMIFVRGSPNLGGKGYLYTLAGDKFEQVDTAQWVSHEPVKPLEILEIKVDDFAHLFRYATEEEKHELEHRAHLNQ